MQPASTTSQYEKIELLISCRNLRNLDQSDLSDPQVRTYLKHQANWVPFARTETKLNELNPDFDTSFKLDFKFEMNQEIKFEVIDIDTETDFDIIGVVETTIGKIMGAKDQILVLDLIADGAPTAGKLVVAAQKAEDDRNIILWQWKASNLINTDGPYEKSDPFLRFYKKKVGGGQAYETEAVVNNLNPTWKSFQILDGKLCNDHSQSFIVECWDWERGGKHQFIGKCEVSLSAIKAGSTQFDLFNSKLNKNTGTLQVSNFSTKKPSSFIEYLKGGTQLNVVVAIDFTASNGDPSQSDSLHSTKVELNEYQKAIWSICQIVLNYDFDQSIPVYGFGGWPNYPTFKTKDTSHCFPLTGNPEQPEVPGVEGVMGVYGYALKNVDLSGPTYFNPLISEAVKGCTASKNAGKDNYTILLILTDGEIHDMDKTIDTIVKASELPMSIIIVGIGDANFKNMEVLDGDSGLIDSKGEAAERDLVQFVPFREYNGDMYLLAQRVLAEIPEQVVGYMQLIDKKPNLDAPGLRREDAGYTPENPKQN